MTSACHACARPAELRPGTYGDLCASCWTRVLAIIAKILGRPSRWAQEGAA